MLFSRFIYLFLNKLILEMRSTDVLKNSNPIYAPNGQCLSGEARGLKSNLRSYRWHCKRKNKPSSLKDPSMSN